MWEVDGRNNERDKRVAAVVLRVGEDGEVRFQEGHFFTLLAHAGWKCDPDVPTSPATSLSRPENTRSQSLNSSAVHFFTTKSPMRSVKGRACFHLTASLYFLPADRSEAPTAWRTKCGWSASRRMKRCPTEPVAPRTPARRINGAAIDRILYYLPHFFLGNSAFFDVKCSASMAYGCDMSLG